jgi:hypothetical protein
LNYEKLVSPRLKSVIVNASILMMPSPALKQLKELIVEGYATTEQIRWYRYMIEFNN